MAVGDTSTSVVNEALMLMGGNKPPVTGVAPNFDDTTNGKAAAALYAPCVATVMREFSFDFARNTAPLVVTGNVAPYPWTYEYKWPTDNTIQIWQLSPMTEVDPNDPLPVNFVVANAVVGGKQARVIQTDLQNAQAIFNNYPNESTWDALFHAAVVRLLASEFSTATAGKPDLARALLESGSAFESIGEQRSN